jgi:hypothetical protein
MFSSVGKGRLMSPSAAEALNPSSRNGIADGKIWDREPRLTLIDEWREHIRRTGEPDTFRYHCHSKPRTEDPPRIIADGFDVPERFRLSKRLAPCTLCSLHGPKYSEGCWRGGPRKRHSGRSAMSAVCVTGVRRSFRQSAIFQSGRRGIGPAVTANRPATVSPSRRR